MIMFDWLKKNLTAVYIIIAVITIIAPWLLTRGWFGIDFTETGQVGDTIGGLTAPFLNLLSVTLLYLTLKDQIKINERQELSLKDQISVADRNYLLSLLSDFRSELNTICYRDNDTLYYGHEALLMIKNKADKNKDAVKLDKETNIFNCLPILLRFTSSTITYARLNYESKSPISDKYLFYGRLKLYNDDVINALKSISNLVYDINPELKVMIERNQTIFNQYDVILP